MCSVALSRPTLCDCMDCSRPGSSFHGILQARILEWVAVTSSRGPSQPRDRTHVSCTGGRFFTDWATREYKAEKLLFKENDHINCTKEERAIPLQKTTQKLCVLVISELCFLFFAFFFYLTSCSPTKFMWKPSNMNMNMNMAGQGTINHCYQHCLLFLRRKEDSSNFYIPFGLFMVPMLLHPALPLTWSSLLNICLASLGRW